MIFSLLAEVRLSTISSMSIPDTKPPIPVFAVNEDNVLELVGFTAIGFTPLLLVACRTWKDMFVRPYFIYRLISEKLYISEEI